MNAPDYESIWQQSLIRVTDKFSLPPILLRVDDATIGTLGNFSVSTGKAKAKKTFNVSALVASALADGQVLEYRACFPESKRNILYFDTEQSPYHCQLVMQRILRLAGLPKNDFSFGGTKTSAQQGLETLSVQPISNSQLPRYGSERGISLSQLEKYCSEVRYRSGERSYYALGYPNDAGGWKLRNPYFKGCIAPKAMSTLAAGAKSVQVFGGFMDFLSWRTLHPNEPSDSLVLNSLILLPRALPQLQTYPCVECFLDNDEAGRKALHQLREAGIEVKDMSGLYAPYKDLNEWLCAESKSQKQAQTPRKRGLRR